MNWSPLLPNLSVSGKVYYIYTITQLYAARIGRRVSVNMILKSRIIHNNVIGIKVRELDDRVEIVVECSAEGRVLVNKHRIYGRLDSVNLRLKGEIMYASMYEIKFKNPINCLILGIDTLIENKRWPLVSIQLDKCDKVATDTVIDEIFSYANLGRSS